MVVYARIVEEKKIGPMIVGVYFGGIGETEKEANQIADACTLSTIQGNIIIARVIKLSNNNIITTAKNMIDIFERLVENMHNNISSLKRKKNKKLTVN